MPEPMKKPLISENIFLTFTGPVKNKEKAIEALKSLRFVNTAESTPWRDAFPEYDDNEMPGVCLAGARHRENFTQARLSEITEIPQRHISEMENAKRPIGKKNAKILAKALNTNYQNFL